MASLKNHPGRWLRDDAAAAFDAYEDKYGKRTVNSAGRTVAEQQALINRWDRGGAANRPPYLYAPARPASASNHVAGGGLAVDIADYNTFKQHSEEFGFKWFGPSDPVHFTFVGRPGAPASVSQDTKNRQAWLNSRGWQLAVDGIEGPITKAAYKEYQRQLNQILGTNLATDGIWGPATQAAHQRFYDSLQAPPAPAGGASSDVVRAVQAKLKANYPLYAGRLVVDGIAGPATRAAVKEFQRRSGLTADGIIGPQTRARLGV